jgi:hypothetical protein
VGLVLLVLSAHHLARGPQARHSLPQIRSFYVLGRTVTSFLEDARQLDEAICRIDVTAFASVMMF